MSSFESISATAKFMAYLRQFTDIPFARDVAESLEAQKTVENFLRDHQLQLDDINWYGPLFEARYKSIQELLRRSGIQQVLELASGVSLRGFAMARDPQVRYVESDLEGITREKENFIPQLYQKHQLPNHHNLELIAVNALEKDQINQAVQYFDPGKPIAVVNEGLLQYLSSEELEKVALNVAGLLRRFGGIWITPDFSVKKDAESLSEKQARVRQAIAAMTNRRLSFNAFENEDALQKFFDRAGLTPQVHDQLSLTGEMTCVKPLHIQPDFLNSLNGRLKIWVLSPR